MNSAELAARLGKSVSTINNWRTIGILEPCAGGHGRGDNVWWEPRHVLIGEVARDLLGRGCPVGWVRDGCRLVARFAAWDDLVLMIVGGEVSVLPVEELAVWDWLSGGGVAWCVPLGYRERAWQRVDWTADE